MSYKQGIINKKQKEENMKAKDLIKFLEKFPEAEVGFLQYTGCDTPFLTAKEATLYTKGANVTEAFDDGELIKNKKAQTDLILLKTRN